MEIVSQDGVKRPRNASRKRPVSVPASFSSSFSHDKNQICPLKMTRRRGGRRHKTAKRRYCHRQTAIFFHSTSSSAGCYSYFIMKKSPMAFLLRLTMPTNASRAEGEDRISPNQTWLVFRHSNRSGWIHLIFNSVELQIVQPISFKALRRDSGPPSHVQLLLLIIDLFPKIKLKKCSIELLMCFTLKG